MNIGEAAPRSVGAAETIRYEEIGLTTPVRRNRNRYRAVTIATGRSSGVRQQRGAPRSLGGSMRRLSMMGIPMVCGALVVAAPWGLAHEGATGAVKERMDFMESMGKAMKGLGEMLQGKRPFDLAEARADAQTIAEHTSVILEQFPEGSNQHPSKALPIIWQEWPAFEQAAAGAQEQSRALRLTLDNGAQPQAVLGRYAALGKACSGCHDRYRSAS